VGQTENFEKRLEHHNQGRNKYTAKGIPWIFIHKMAVSDRTAAILLENKIKKRGIKRYLNDIKFGM
jgi:putative endonuclease